MNRLKKATATLLTSTALIGASLVVAAPAQAWWNTTPWNLQFSTKAECQALKTQFLNAPAVRIIQDCTKLDRPQKGHDGQRMTYYMIASLKTLGELQRGS